MTDQNHEDGKPVYDSPGHLEQQLNLRSVLVAEKMEILGWMRTHEDTLEAVLHLPGKGSLQQYHPVVLPRADSIATAKEILRKLDPSALDPDTRLHDTVQRIDRNVGILLEKTEDQ